MGDQDAVEFSGEGKYPVSRLFTRLGGTYVDGDRRLLRHDQRGVALSHVDDVHFQLCVALDGVSEYLVIQHTEYFIQPLVGFIVGAAGEHCR